LRDERLKIIIDRSGLITTPTPRIYTAILNLNGSKDLKESPIVSQENHFASIN
jgi:hypothetical protein